MRRIPRRGGLPRHGIARALGGARFERDARARRERARTHLARVRDRQRNRRATRRRALSPPVAAGVLAAALAAGLFAGRPLVAAARASLSGAPARLGAIHVLGAHRLSGLEVAAASGVAPGAPLDTVDASDVERRIATHPWIARARAVFDPTGALVVEVAEREPRAVVMAGTPPRALAVDAEGRPFADAGESDREALPLLVPATPALPEAPSPDLAEAVELAGRLAALSLAAPRAIEIAPAGDPGGLALRFAGFPARVVLGRGALEPRLAALVRVLAAGAPALSEAEEIDLRFEGQVVLRSAPARDGGARAAARGSAAPPTTGPAG